MGLFARRLKGTCSSFQIVFFRSIVTFIVVYSIASFRGVSVKGENRRILLLRGIFGGIALVLFFYTILHIKLASSFILNKTSPAFAALFSVLFLREKYSIRKFVSLVMTIFGVYLVIAPEEGISSPDVTASLCGLLSGILSACAYVCVKKARETDRTETIVLYFAAVSVLFTVYPALTGDFSAFHGTVWLYLMLVGLSSAFAQILMTYGYGFLTVSEATIISSATIVNTALIGYFVFSEVLSIPALAGGILVIVSIIMISAESNS